MTTLEPSIGATAQKTTAGAPTRRLRGIWRTSPGRMLRLIFLWGDLVAVVAAVVLSGVGRPWGITTAALMICGNATAKLYRHRLSLSWGRDTPRGLAAAAAVLGLVTSAAVLLGERGPQTRGIVRCVAIAVLLLGTFRLIVSLLAAWARRRGIRERILVAGTGPIGLALVQAMQEHPQFGLEPVGFVDRTPTIPGVELPLPVVGSDLAEAVRESQVRTVVLAFSGTVRDSQVVDAAITAHQAGAAIYAVPRMFEMYHDGVDVERLRSYPLVRLTPLPTERPSWLVKRAIDILVAGTALLLVAPFMALIAAAVLLESGRPVLFRQCRIGRLGATFDVLKFRSMRPADEGESQTKWNIAGDPRVGKVGRILRRTSLDELPQLWNIVRGDMSLVGPRPERPTFVEEFTVAHLRYWARHRVPAGLTGLAQINGLRGDTSIAERARYDNYYIANWSLWLDLQIVVLTIRELFRRGMH
jgi:exopolysaccharide biosynthesis polyprenyl glycosylphosphotransferase